MASPKPTLLIVGGAWHLPECYALLKTQLEARGYDCLVPRLRTVGEEARGRTWEADVAMIRELVHLLFDQGKQVIIIGHSYGGIPASISTEGLSVGERATEGRKGGFAGIIFMNCFAVPEKGMDMLSLRGGKWFDYMTYAEPYTRNSLTTVLEGCKQVFYNDLPEEEAQGWFEKLLPHSQDALETPVNFTAADIKIPTAFLLCELDAAIPLELQQGLVASVPGLIWRQVRAGHSPFLSKPNETGEKVVEMIGEILARGSE